MDFDDYVKKVEAESSEEELALLEKAREYWKREAERIERELEDE